MMAPNTPTAVAWCSQCGYPFAFRRSSCLRCWGGLFDATPAELTQSPPPPPLVLPHRTPWESGGRG